MPQNEWPVEEFRALLDRVLQETGLTQGALAALVPMDQSQLSRWKSGGSRPKYENLAALADAVQREYPHAGITKREILAAAGYGATLPDAARTVSETQAVAQPHLEAIDGGKLDPRDYTEQTFYAEYEAGRRHFDHPPHGFQDQYERDIWAAEWTFKEFPQTEFLGKYGIIKAHREKIAQQRAQEAARRVREGEQDRRRSNGA